MAASIARELGVETTLVEGRLGEFTVWVDDVKVAAKGWFRLPADDTILDAVKRQM